MDEEEGHFVIEVSIRQIRRPRPPKSPFNSREAPDAITEGGERVIEDLVKVIVRARTMAGALYKVKRMLDANVDEPDNEYARGRQ